MELKGQINELKGITNKLKGEVSELKDEVKEGTEELKNIVLDVWELLSKQQTPLQHPALVHNQSPYQTQPPPLQLVQLSFIGRPFSFGNDLLGMGQCLPCFSASC